MKGLQYLVLEFVVALVLTLASLLALLVSLLRFLHKSKYFLLAFLFIFSTFKRYFYLLNSFVTFLVSIFN